MAESLHSTGESPTLSEGEATNQFLTVDAPRLRAHSDPAGLHLPACTPPEIKVTSDDGMDNEHSEDDDLEGLLQPPPQRQRAGSCPEDLFRTHKERPPTPPPADLKKNRARKRFSFNFPPKDVSGISFAHHKLGKLQEDNNELPLLETDEDVASDSTVKLRAEESCSRLLCDRLSYTDQSVTLAQRRRSCPVSLSSSSDCTAPCDSNMNQSFAKISVSPLAETKSVTYPNDVTGEAKSLTYPNDVTGDTGKYDDSSDSPKWSTDSWCQNDTCHEQTDTSRLKGLLTRF